MINMAMNIETLYPGMDISEKIERVSAAGYKAIEFWTWHDKDLDAIKKTCEKCGVKIWAFCATKEWSLCDRAHADECVDWIRKSIQTAKDLNCDKVILFPNHFRPNGAGAADFRDQYSHEAMIASITADLVRVAPDLEEAGVTAYLEPLVNTGADAGMSVTDTSVGADIIRAVNSPCVKVLCDVFHMQIMHGNLLPNIAENMDIVDYIHVADSPDRHEPGTGEINFDYLFTELRNRGYEGTVCFEYFPQGDTEESFPSLTKVCDILTR
ncbi:MAG: TIM barrel protein [Eubacterium sp.]|nr:TIM barrel protein [Eubacterium sp.]